MRTLGLALACALVAGLAVASGEARRPAPPTVELGSTALLAPDGLSFTTSVTGSCADRSTVQEARLTASQARASGDGTFAPACIGPFPRPFPVTVVSRSGVFALGSVQATATLVVQRGKIEQAQDSGALQLEPAVVVDLAETARLVDGGRAVSIGVAVSCPPGPLGLQSYVVVSQGNVVGRGFYEPVCDGAVHTFTVTAVASEGTFRAGDARSLSFADVVWNGSFFTGVGDEPLRIVAS